MADSCASIPPGADRHSSSDDNTLLWDVVRVVTRLVAASRSAGTPAYQGFRIEHDRTASDAEIQRMTTRQRQERQTGHIVSSSALPRRFAKRTHGAENTARRMAEI